MRSGPLKSYRYYDLILGAYVCVLLCANLIGPGQGINGTRAVVGAGDVHGGRAVLSDLLLFGDILTEVYGYARDRRVV